MYTLVSKETYYKIKKDYNLKELHGSLLKIEGDHEWVIGAEYNNAYVIEENFMEHIKNSDKPPGLLKRLIGLFTRS